MFAAGIVIYSRAGAHFSWSQLGGLPEVRAGNQNQRLVTTGIRSRVRHPSMSAISANAAWSVGTGLAVCWMLTVFAIVTHDNDSDGDAELEERFGSEFVSIYQV